MRTNPQNTRQGGVTVVSWNYSHGKRHCVSETVQLLQREGLLERLISNTYEVYDSNLNKIEPDTLFSAKIAYLILRIKNIFFKKYKKVQFREWLFDNFARKNLGQPGLIFLDAERFPAVIKHAIKNNISTICYQRTAHVNYSTSVLIEESEKRKFKTGYLNKGLNNRRLKCINNVDFILAHSQFVKDTDIAYGIGDSKIKVVYGCVDASFYLPPAMPRKEPAIVLFVGHDPILKGLFYLLEAWELIYKKVDNAELWVVGNNQASVIGQYNKLERVRFLGYQGDINTIYQKASLLVQPSLVDAGPKSVTEAMSAGLPVIVSNAIGYSEIVEDGVNGYVVPARDHIKLAEKIKYCIDHQDELQRMGKSARATVEKLTHQYHAKKVVDSLRSILGSGSF